jgi:hypothetical protein
MSRLVFPTLVFAALSELLFAPGRVNAESVVATIAPSDPTQQIDQHVQRMWDDLKVTPADRCSDRSFVRRVYLDLAGRVPTAAELDRLLEDEREDRRQRLIDRLLNSEDYVQNFADLFDALLMGRAAEKKYEQRRNHHWRSYLETVIRENRPWDEVVAEILLARPDDVDHRGAVWFLYERENRYQQIAESIAPAFFGVRIECAQCHDHMVADEIKQEHYWGLVAFFNRSKNENTELGPRLVESAIGGFSEFADIEGHSSPNVLAFVGAKTVPEDRPDKDAKPEDAETLYRAGSPRGEPRVPNFSRREKFVNEIVDGHPLVARAMVNRVWAMLMARGIVHPFDEMDSVHEPSHPELLDWLASDFISSGYDIRRLVRAIAQSDAYQLKSIQPEGVNDPSSFAWYLERPLTAEQMARSIQLVVRGETNHDEKLVGLLRQQFKDVLPDMNIVTVTDTLFMSNNVDFDKYLRESIAPEHLVPSLLAMNDHRSRADAICNAVFGRAPTDEERDAIVSYLEKRPDSLQTAMTQIVWSLLTSAEFRFNH